MTQPKIEIYSKAQCPYCDRAKALLTNKGVSYEEIRIDLFPERKEEMIQRANGGRTVPQIFIDGQHMGGCDDIHALDAQGKLDPYLKQEKKAMSEEHHQVIILGSGPAGYTAAIYAARANLKPFLLAGPQKGGQLTTTTEVENFPGFEHGIDGNQLMNNMEAQAARFETKIEYGEVRSVDLSKRPFTLVTDDKTYKAEALIIATGASAKYLGLNSETAYRNHGVSACATCDGFFYKGQSVAVVGGGDTALEEASYLANICSKVYLIHRRQDFRASVAMQTRVKNNPKIEMVLDSAVDEVLGDGKLMTDLKVKNLKTGATRNLGCTGLFVAIGHSPNTEAFRGQLALDGMGYILLQGGTSRTSVEGVFAAGDVADPHYRQAITAAGMGCRAAIDAERWLGEQE